MFKGCFSGHRKIKSCVYLPNLAGNHMGQNYNGLLVKVIYVRRLNNILFAFFNYVLDTNSEKRNF